MSDAGKVVLVTGCSEGGIGYHLCKQFALRGCRVHATARRLEAMHSLAKDGIHTHVLDVTSDSQTKEVVETILAREGKIDIAVCNAGISCIAAAVDTTPEQATKVFDTNVVAALRMARTVLPHMAARRSGTIVNIGSVAGEIPVPFTALYAASKAALHTLTRVLTLEARPLGVQVMLVAPALVLSNIGDNQATSFAIPEDSLYKGYKDKLIRHMHAANGPDAQPTDIFARQVVERALWEKVPWYYMGGGGAWRFKLLVWFPRWLIMSLVWYLVAVA